MTTNALKHRWHIAAGIDAATYKSRSQFRLYDIPGSLNRLLAVMRMLACDAFSPRTDSIDLHFHQHHPPLGSSSETGFKEMHERHMQLAKSDTLYVHDAVSCSLDELNSKFSWGRASK